MHFLDSNGASIVRCEGCTLLFVNPRPTEASIARHFVEEYIDDNRKIEQGFTEWRYATLKREAIVLKQLMVNGGRLLDLGTASGVFLSFFRDSEQWDVEGVEPSRYAAVAASKKYGVKVHPGFITDVKLADQSFDVVTSLDAFYFHCNPADDIREIFRILRPGGYFAVEIPGLRFRLLKNTGVVCRLLYGVPARLNAGVHLFYYSRKTFRELARRAGFVEIYAAPQASPDRGGRIVRILNAIYFAITSWLYRITGGSEAVPVPKEFLVYQKQS